MCGQYKKYKADGVCGEETEMSFERSDYGISGLRTSLRTASDGRRSLFASGFEGGTGTVGRKLTNAIYSGGKVCTVGAPKTYAQKAVSVSRAENLLYEIGPGTDAGKNEFFCHGRGEMEDTFSSDGKLTMKTIIFDKSKDGESEYDDSSDYVWFNQSLEKKSYFLHLIISPDTMQGGLMFTLKSPTGRNYALFEAGIMYGHEKQDVFISFDVPSAGTYEMCFGPVYENADFDPDECYRAEIMKMYLFDTAATVKSGITQNWLESMEFDGRYYDYSLPFAITGKRICASCEHDGNLYFATEKSVYRMKDGVVYVLCKSRHGAGGSFYTFGADVYFADGDRILRFSEFGSDEIYAEPTQYTNCTYNGSSYKAGKKNPLSVYADVTFGISSELTRSIPYAIGHRTDFCEIYDGSGNLVPSSAYTTEKHNGALEVTLKEATSSKLTVRVRISDAEAEENFGVRSAFFGGALFDEGEGGSGKKLMGTYADKIYVITLTDVGIADENVLSVSAGDAVTALVSSGEERFVFTEKSIKRVGFDGASLSVTPVKNGFGCDIPGSAVCFSEGVYFANTYGGVYYIDKDRESSVDVCRRVSAPVHDEFFAMVSSGKEMSGICCDGKYYLFAGDDVLIWDAYEKRPSTVLSAPEERKLVWYRAKVDGFEGAVCAVGDRIYYLCTGGIKHFGFASGSGDGIFETETLYPDGMFVEKRISKVCISARLGKSAVLRIKLDGEMQADTYTLCAGEKPTVYTVSIPGRNFYGFALQVSGGDFEIYGVGTEYYI